MSDRVSNIRTIRLLALLACISAIGGCLSSETSLVPNSAGGAPASGNDGANSPPLISGTPDAAVLAGDTYSFEPSASDADGDSLSFSISNKPSWASFDTTTGELSGQALLGDVGSYTDIQITVSDGSATRSLPAFSITVTQVGLGSMSLSWTAPTQNTDGSVLTDLAGYKLYYGKSPGNYDTTVRIDNPSISTYLVDNLVPDTYYVVATSFNASGVESAYSGQAVKTVSSD